MSDREKKHPLSASQTQIWIGQQKFPQSPLYNMAYSFAISGPVRAGQFESAWIDVAQRHHSLQARIVEESGVVWQHFAGDTAALQHFDFSEYRNPTESAEDWMRHQVQSVFDMTASLVVSALLKVADDRWIWYCNQHHLISDAWSFQLLWHDLTQRYFQRGNRRLPDAAPPASIYRDYLREEKSTRDNLADDPRFDHWRNRQSTGPLTLYHLENERRQTEALRISHLLSDDQVISLQQLCELPAAKSFSVQLSRYHVLLAIYVIYLHRVSAGENITLYTPLANRDTDARRACPGLLIELLPLRLSISSSDTFTAVLAKVRTEMAECLKHSQPGVAALVSQPDCTAVLNVVTTAMSDFGDWPASVNWLHNGHTDAHHVMRLHLCDYPQNQNTSLLFEFNRGCFSADQSNNAVTHWWRVFDAVVNDSDVVIGRIELSNPDLREVRPAAVDAGGSLSLPELIQATIDKTPDAIAVCEAGSRVSYREFGVMVNRITLRLKAIGIGEGDRVVICAQRSLHLPAALVACLNLGAVYVPVDALTPIARIANMLQQCEPALVIATERTRMRLPAACSIALLSELAQDSPADESPLAEKFADVSSGQLAYIMFTSGSTGDPKGVMITHGALSNYIQWAADFYTNGVPLAFPLYTSIGFDLTVTSLYVPLVSGGRIVVYTESDSPVDLLLLDVIRDNCVDIIKLTPAHLSMLQGQPLSESRVKQLIVGGDDLKRQLAGRISAAFPSLIAIHNEYGPTEATVGCIVHTFDPRQDAGKSVPIGLTVAGMGARIVNEYGIAQPDGVAGELILSGPSLATGYWNQPDETALRFTTMQGQRCYKTGDNVRKLSSGRLVFLGRIDNQVKLNGHRIELGEIESVCLRDPAIVDCVAVMHRSAEPGQQGVSGNDVIYCTRCGLSSEYPSAVFNADDVCHLCERFENYRFRADQYFRPSAELQQVVAEIKSTGSANHDCIVLLSGGKDSSYMLASLVDMGLRVLAFTLDNGYISEGAKQNVRRVCSALDVDHVYGQTDAMNNIFKDSLERHANVCHGCFKAIYTLSLKVAEERGIGAIFTGLSRGQFFETRLTEELFTNPDFNVDDIDAVVLNARKSYHRLDDAVSRHMDVSHVQSGDLLDRVRFVDFYRYCDINLNEMIEFLETRLPWVRPSDTGRSTNCLINDVGIYVHKLERGYHNYALPYSWDVRLGHKVRDEALDELDDDIDEVHVQSILSEIDYTPKTRSAESADSLVLYYVASELLDETALKTSLTEFLPPIYIPSQFIPLEKIPLNRNGKIDKSALPLPGPAATERPEVIAPPKNALESQWVELWCNILGLSGVDTGANFFTLGGDSLKAVQVISRINQTGFIYTVPDLFENPTISALASLERTRRERVTGPLHTEAFSQVSAAQLEKLAGLLKKQPR